MNISTFFLAALLAGLGLTVVARGGPSGATTHDVMGGGPVGATTDGVIGGGPVGGPKP